MNRRSFLKWLGVAAVAVTMPKTPQPTPPAAIATGRRPSFQGSDVIPIDPLGDIVVSTMEHCRDNILGPYSFRDTQDHLLKYRARRDYYARHRAWRIAARNLS